MYFNFTKYTGQLRRSTTGDSGSLRPQSVEGVLKGPCLVSWKILSLHWTASDSYGKQRSTYDDVIKWKHFLRYWPFVRGIHRSPLNSPQNGQWRGALMFSFICAWINAWENNRKADDLRRHPAHYDVIVMSMWYSIFVMCTQTALVYILS